MSATIILLPSVRALFVDDVGRIRDRVPTESEGWLAQERHLAQARDQNNPPPRTRPLLVINKGRGH